MKKIILLCLFSLGFGFFAFTHAQDISSVGVSFCNPSNGDNLMYTLQSGVETGVCYTINNNSASDIMVKVSFVDGGFTNDQRKNKSCGLENVVQPMFGQYVTGYESVITLKGGTVVTGNASLLFPQGMNGFVHGCLVYSVVTPVASTDGKAPTFAIQMRKAKFIDALVGNPDQLSANNGIIFEDFTAADGENLSSNSKVRIYKDLDDKYIVAFKLKNVSIFDQNVVLTGVASNFLMYKNVFFTSRLVPQSQSVLVTQKLDTVPNYNLHVLLNLSYDPILFGDLKSTGGTVLESVGFMIWNIVTRLTLLGLIVVIGIIFLLIKDLNKRNKKNKK